MKLNQAVISLLLRQPYYGYILSSLKHEKNRSVKDIEVHPGPTVRLVYNPDWFEELSPDKAHGVLIHELLHLLLLHSLRRNSRDKAYWYFACDLAVNEQIPPILLPGDYLNIERFNVKVKPVLPFEPKQSAEYYYERLKALEKDKAPDFTWHNDELSVHLPDESDASIKVPKEPDLSEINCRAVECALEEITRQAAEEGEIPGELKNALKGIYHSVQVNWRNVLKKYLAGKGRMEIRKTVKKVSKRFDDMPGNRRTKGLEALVAVDESGSIADDDIMAFFNELKIINRAVKADLMVTRFDTDCTAPVPLRRYLIKRNRIKQGGTDFRPVFKLADRLGSRLVLIFTDGDGIYPSDAKQKVLWIMTGENVKELPFGEWVRFS